MSLNKFCLTFRLIPRSGTPSSISTLDKSDPPIASLIFSKYSASRSAMDLCCLEGGFRSPGHRFKSECAIFLEFSESLPEAGSCDGEKNRWEGESRRRGRSGNPFPRERSSLVTVECRRTNIGGWIHVIVMEWRNAGERCS